MPSGLVQTKEDEKLWEKAKKIVRDEYKISEDSSNFWKLVVAIYLRMKGGK